LVASSHSLAYTLVIVLRRELALNGVFTTVEKFKFATTDLRMDFEKWNICDTQVRWEVDVLFLSLPSSSYQRTRYLQSRQKVHCLYVRSSTTLSLFLSRVTTPSPSQQQTTLRFPDVPTQPTSFLKNQKSTNEQGGIFKELSERSIVNPPP
jgi:hypothetical protein